MAAYEIPNLRFSAASGAAVARRRFVKIDGAGNAIQAVAGDAAVGVSMIDVPAAGQVLEIADGIMIVEAGTALASGVAVQADATGRAIILAAGVKTGYSMTAAGAAGELITIKTN